MSVPTWPFKRQRPTGYVDDGTDVPSAADLTGIDEQLSRAANGLLWSDAALAKNFRSPTTFSGSPVGFPVYDRTSGLWVVASSLTTSSYKIFVSADHATNWSAANVASGYPNLTFRCAASNGAGRIAFGYEPAAGSTTKILYSDDGFVTHSSAGAVGPATAGLGVVGLMYSARLGLWVAGLSDGSIYTSPDLAAFTQRFAGDGRPRVRFAESGDRIISVPTSGSGWLTSTDGITWSGITAPTGLPSGITGICFVTSPIPEFVAVWNTAGPVYGSARSADGATWDQTTTGSGPSYGAGTYTPFNAVAYGRMVVASGTDDVYFSLDAARTWKRSGEFAPPSPSFVGTIGLGEDQLLAIVNNNISNDALVYRGIRGGL